MSSPVMNTPLLFCLPVTSSFHLRLGLPCFLTLSIFPVFRCTNFWLEMAENLELEPLLSCQQTFLRMYCIYQMINATAKQFSFTCTSIYLQLLYSKTITNCQCVLHLPFSRHSTHRGAVWSHCSHVFNTTSSYHCCVDVSMGL